MKKSIHPSYSRIEKFLALVVLALIGFLVCYVHKVDVQSSALSVAQSQSSVPKFAKQLKPTGKAQNGYLDVREWGVSLELNSTVKDADYYVVPTKNNVVFLSTLATDKLPTCHKQMLQSPSSPTDQLLIRYSLNEIVTGVAGYSQNGLTAKMAAVKVPEQFKIINGSVYQYVNQAQSGVSCTKNDDLNRAFKAAFLTLSPAQ